MKGWKSIVNQEKYRDWAETANGISLFLQPWWLDTVCYPDKWQGILLTDTDDNVLAAWPIHTRKKYGLTWILPPKMTPHTGPWIAPEKSQPINPSNARQRYWSIMDNLIDALPKTAMSLFHLAPEFQDHLPFHWKHFRQTTRYSFRMNTQGKTVEQIFSGFKSSIRNDIRHAEESLICVQTEDIEKLLKVNSENFSKKQRTMPVNASKLSHILTTAMQKSVLKSWLVSDRNDTLMAAASIIVDRNTAYLSLSGTTSGANRGAISFMYKHIIEYCLDKQLDLDFEGSMIPEVARVFASYGADQISYHRIYKGDIPYFFLGIR
jgi:hypothetical protein